jgi:MFS transporter, Spinster family, sphingosine-1-phosphate transporter
LSEVTPSQPAAPGVPSTRARVGRYAAYVFWLMFLINFINYFDRFIFAGLSPQIKHSLDLNDFQVGLATSVFVGIYTIVSLPLGFLADRLSRKSVVAAGVGVWSIASFATGLAGNFATLLGVRTILGVGEGSYYPAGTPMLAAYYPPARRSTVFARWTVGALLGGAVGFLAASFFKHGEAWRLAFLYTGVPGLILAVLVWFTRNKTRHEEDPGADHLPLEGPGAFARFKAYFRIPTVRTITLSQAFAFFASGSAVTFFTIYVHDTFVTGAPGFRTAGLSSSLDSVVAGGVVLVGGILGTLYGSRLGAQLSKRNPGGRVAAGGIGSFVALGGAIVSIGSKYLVDNFPGLANAPESTRLTIGLTLFCVGGTVAAFGLNLYQGPFTSALLEVVPPNERAGVGGTSLAFSHLLGDSYSSALVGAVSVLLANSLGGSQTGLAMLLCWPIPLIASGLIGIYGSRQFASDVAAVAGATEPAGAVMTTPSR